MSIRLMSVVTWVVAMLAFGLFFTPRVLSWAGLVWLSVVGFLLLSGLLMVVTRSRSRTATQVIADTEAEPGLAPATRSGGAGSERMQVGQRSGGALR
jgi:cytochrome c-type biogenesis protein CcmH/NrfF